VDGGAPAWSRGSRSGSLRGGIRTAPAASCFEYFRLLARLRKGEATLEELLAWQDLYDNHFLDSPRWKAVRDVGNH
jgi:hypothetical protein